LIKGLDLINTEIKMLEKIYILGATEIADIVGLKRLNVIDLREDPPTSGI